MMPAETIIAPHRRGGRPGWIRSILLAAAVRLAISAVAFAGGDGDGLVIRSGGAELRSASPAKPGKSPSCSSTGCSAAPQTGRS